MTLVRILSAGLLALFVSAACAGTETGNPGPRGCGAVCNACGAPIVLSFPGAATRTPSLSSIVVDMREVACAPEGSSVRCELSEEFYGVPDSYELRVEVTGAEPIDVRVELPASNGCCACAYDGVTVEIELSDASEG